MGSSRQASTTAAGAAHHRAAARCAPAARRSAHGSVHQRGATQAPQEVQLRRLAPALQARPEVDSRGDGGVRRAPSARSGGRGAGGYA